MVALTPSERDLTASDPLLEDGQERARVGAGQRDPLARHGTRLAERPERAGRHERVVDGQRDDDVVRGRGAAPRGARAPGARSAAPSSTTGNGRPGRSSALPTTRPRRTPRRGGAGRARPASHRGTARGPSASRTGARRRRRAAPRSAGSRGDPLVLRVDGGAPVAHEAAERHAAVLGELDGERRRRPDRDEHRAAGDRGLLDELEREPAADAEDRAPRAAGAPPAEPSRRPCPSRCGARRPRGGSGARRPAPKRPVAWSPPVSANAAWAPRSRSGRPRTTANGTRSPLSTRGASTATASSAPLPQTPHEDEV